MADPDDVVALILVSLEPISSSDLSALSVTLAHESSLQLQRLWLLLGSASHSLSIISFLESLSLRQRRLLLGRLTLRLLRRITDFLAEHAACKHRTIDNFNGRSVSESHAVGDRRPEDVDPPYPTLCVGTDGEMTMGAAARSLNATHVEAQGACTQQSGEAREYLGALPYINKLPGSAQDGSERVDRTTVRCRNDSPSRQEDKKIGGETMEMCVPDSPVSIFGRFDKEHGTVLGKVRQAAAGSRSPGRTGVQPDRVGDLETVALGDREGRRGETFDDPTATSRADFQESESPAGTIKERGILGLDKVYNRRQPWGDTDAAFLLLFLSETQEQECQEAMRKWCIDPHVYRHFIVRDMATLVGDESKGVLVRAPKWRESLQQYLLQNILQVGYGVPGMVSSANFPTSLSAYIDTIGRFQRLLRSVNGEASHQQKLPLPPASAATLLSLPTIAIGSCKDEKWRLCCICGEEFEPATVASQLPCSHVYHWDCILPWLKQRNTCPVCRHELPTDDLDYELQRQKQILLERAP